MRGWLPFRWRKQFVQVEHAKEFIALFDLELTPHAAFGTGTPPIRTFDPMPRYAQSPLDVTIVPTGIGRIVGQPFLTSLSEQ